MASKTDVANLALIKLGHTSIVSIDDENESARTIRAVFDMIRDGELRAHNWNFSIKRTTLPALSDAPISNDYTVQYQLPADCLRVIQAGDSAPGGNITWYNTSQLADYQVEGRKIVTNLPAPLSLRYIYRAEAVGDWDALFVEMVACRIAAETCEKFTQSATKRDLALKQYGMALADATRADAIENPPEPISDGSWLLSRL